MFRRSADAFLSLKFLPALGFSIATVSAVDALIFWLMPDYQHCLSDPPGSVWWLLTLSLVSTLVAGVVFRRIPLGKAMLVSLLPLLILFPFIVFMKEFNMC